MMKLLPQNKLARVSLVALAAVMTSAAVVWTYLDRAAIADVQREAEYQMSIAGAIRAYTVDHLQPRFPIVGLDFRRELVPSYAATTALAYLHQGKDGYGYREVALNPSNPANRAEGWQAELVQELRAQPSLTQVFKTTGSGADQRLHFARPIKVQSTKCLSCHGTPEDAPAAMKVSYGDQRGFGWQLGEVVGAQVISVPVAQQVQRRNEMFGLFVLTMGGMLFVVLASANLLVFRSVLAPIQLARNSFERLAMTDALTGAFNKRRFDFELEEVLAYVNQSNGVVSVLMIDLDHFKAVNDTHGHAVGDAVLKEVSWRVRARIRRSDIFARLGGEEFAVLCTQTDVQGAEITAKSLLQALAEPHPTAGKVTASVGVAQWQAGESAEDLMKRADAALYEAKNAGRNRVVVSGAIQKS